MPANPRRRLGDRVLAVTALAGVAVLAAAGPAFAALPGVDQTQLVSVNTPAAESSNSPVSTGRVSANGRYVVFASVAQDLVTVPVSTGGHYDVFRRDLVTGETVLVSFDSTGLLGANGASGGAAMSADGRYVVFDSAATNLDPLDTDPDNDIFLRDMDLGVTTLVSVNLAGTAAGGDYSSLAAISGDGSLVTFTSRASDLVLVDGNGKPDVFSRTVGAASPVTTLLSLRVDGTQTTADSGSAPAAISFDGRYVAFDSFDTSIFPAGTTGNQIYRKDLVTNETRGVSYGLAGSNASGDYPSISADGTLVAFSSDATNLHASDTNGVTDVFVRSLIDDSLIVVSAPGAAGTPDDSTHPSISADGRFVAFESKGTDLVADTVTGDGDVYVRNLAAGVTTLVSRNLVGTAGGSGRSYGVTLSNDGSMAAFASQAADLASNDLNSQTDMFARGLNITDPAKPALAATGVDSTPGVLLFGALLATGLLLVRRRSA